MSEKAKAFNRWKCLSCEGHPEFDHKEAMEHITGFHGLAKDAMGQKKTIMHADGREFFRYDYEWTFGEFGELKFIQSIQELRRGEDKRFWADL